MSGVRRSAANAARHRRLPGAAAGRARARPEPPLRLWVAEDPDARLAFTGRRDGNLSRRVGGGDVAGARARLTGFLGLEAEAAVYMEQVHGAEVAVVGADDRGRAEAVPGADALVTFQRDVALVVLVADCVPLLLVDPGRGVAAVHAGRRGIAAGIVPAAVAAVRGPGPAARVVAVIGPGIGGCCYEVPDELAAAVAATVPAARATTSWGTPALDLPAAVAAQLETLGVGRVERVGGCTRCHPGRWFSHRAAAAAPGRHAGVVCRRAGGHGRVAAAPSGGTGCLQW